MGHFFEKLRQVDLPENSLFLCNTYEFNYIWTFQFKQGGRFTMKFFKLLASIVQA